VWASLGIAIGFAAPFFYIWYNAPAPSPGALMYVGAVTLGVSQLLAFSNLEIVLSKQITQHRDEVGSSVARVSMLHGLTLAAARFVGPFFMAFVIPIFDTVTNAAPQCGLVEVGGGGALVNSTCCIAPQGFDTATCSMENVNVVIPIFVGVQVLSCAMGLVYLFKIVDYPPDIAPELVGDDDDAASSSRVSADGRGGNVGLA